MIGRMVQIVAPSRENLGRILWMEWLYLRRGEMFGPGKIEILRFAIKLIGA